MGKNYLLRLLLGLVLFLSSCHKKEQSEASPIEVVGYRIRTQTIAADFEFVGVAKSSHPVEIRSRVEGYLQSINYTEGDRVGVGELLFRIDPSQFEASLKRAKGELARQEAILWRAKRSLGRLEPLYEQNAASERDRDNALAQVLAGEATVIEAEANLTQAELNLSYTYITSPIDGLTARATQREGTLITPSINGVLTEVSVIDPIWVLFSVSDQEVLQGRAEGKANQLILPGEEGYTVQLRLADGSIFPYKGRVNFASPTLDPQTGSLVVRAELPNPDGELLPGQFVEALVSGASRPDAILVPQTAVFQGQKGMSLFVITAEGKAEVRQVGVGEWYKQFWIIQSGLQPGEVVIAEGTNKVQNGSSLKVVSMRQ